MKQKFQIVLACVAFIGLSLWASWPKGEPSWGGKTVSEWLVELAPADSFTMSKEEYERTMLDHDRRRQSAQEAFRNLGESALPHILATLAEAPTMPKWVTQIAEKLEWKLAKPPSENLRVTRACFAMEALGDKARAALPALSHMLDDTKTLDAAAMCLARTGALGVPALAGCLTSSNEQRRLVGIVFLGSVGSNAVAAIPSVLAAVSDANPKVANQAVFAYAKIESDKLKLIAMLLHWAQTNAANPITLMKAMGAIGEWRRPHGAEVQPLIAVLLRFTDDSDDKIKACALSRLAKFEGLAAPARAKALTAIQSETRDMRISGCQLLAALRLEREATVPLLVKLAQEDVDENVRFTALHAAAAFGEAGLPFCGSLRGQVEEAIKVNAQEAKFRNLIAPK